VRNVGWTDKLHGFYLAGGSGGKSSALRITDCVFDGSVAPYYRSQLTINETVDAVVSRCTFINNRNTIRNDDGLLLTQSLLTNAVLIVGSNAKIVQNAFYLDSSGLRPPGYGAGVAIEAYSGRTNVLIENNIVTGLNPAPTFTTPFVQMTSGSLTNWVIRNNYVANRMLLFYSTTGAGTVCSGNWVVYPNYNAGYRGLIDYRTPGLSIVQNTVQAAPAGAAISDAKTGTPVDAKWGNVILEGLVWGVPDTDEL
jgi:hypothetical protein